MRSREQRHLTTELDATFECTKMLDCRISQAADASWACCETPPTGRETPRDARSPSVRSSSSCYNGRRMSDPPSPCGPRSYRDDDSDYDSDASGEYEPLRDSEVSLLTSRASTPPPPPLPPPRPRCASLHELKVPVLPVQFGAPPQTSVSLGDLSARPAAPPAEPRRKDQRRFLGLSVPASPHRFGALWRRWTERPTRAVAAAPCRELNKSLPNLALAGLTTGALGGARTTIPSPRARSPSRHRVSPGALHRALKKVQAKALRRGRPGAVRSLLPQEDDGPTLVALGRLDSHGAPQPAVADDAAETGPGASLSGRIAHSPADVKSRGAETPTSRLPRRCPEPGQRLVPDIVVDPPAQSEDRRSSWWDQADHGSSWRGHADRALPDISVSPPAPAPADGSDYMTMAAIRDILSAPSPPGGLSVPDAGSGTSSPRGEPDYLDMAGIARLRTAFARPTRPARAPPVERFVGTRGKACAAGEYANLADLRRALRELRGADRQVIAEDE
ncbi:potassium/sodium hyperpolarization-activated cyclic nucleotide-gated channel 4-like [Pollicipes pollicipes]|uniref:potassium/sodium hyperpolarization-activated cyclic nucleotide-gated channel 4-like n=1 Tax=Pollicipes pollicipes TaxID=41117 RepID=UPI001884C409|nr:potassium/sodium hyperpolarization-activated cyclic nucleotide-gated channel 4-like [Pollicipes pollicipes]